MGFLGGSVLCGYYKMPMNTGVLSIFKLPILKKQTLVSYSHNQESNRYLKDYVEPMTYLRSLDLQKN